MKKEEAKNILLTKLFDMEAARSKGVDDYGEGDTPFVTSTELNNGVVAYVEPDLDDKVFEGPVIAISGLGHATVQLGHFLPKGNGGDSLTILKPNKPMNAETLVRCAAAFNLLHKWRFSFGRKCSIQRLSYLEIPYPLPAVEAQWNEESALIEKLTKEISEAVCQGHDQKQ